MENLSDLAASALAVTGQGTDQVGSPEHAMTAPGSEPAQEVMPSRDAPPPAEVHPDSGDYRHTVHGDDGGGQDGRGWEDVSGRREPWG